MFPNHFRSAITLTNIVMWTGLPYC